MASADSTGKLFWENPIDNDYSKYACVHSLTVRIHN